MILVHVSNTWPEVLAGQCTPDDATLGNWFNISDAALEEYGDAVLGIYEESIVSAFDTTGPARRDAENRVTFQGVPSARWAYLIGTPNPGKPWGIRGKARPVQYLATSVVEGGTAAIEDTSAARRAVLDGFTLAIDSEGTAVLTVPAGRKVTVLAGAA